MLETRLIRIGQVARNVSLSISKVVQELFKLGIEVENNPNSKISIHQLGLLKEQLGLKNNDETNKTLQTIAKFQGHSSPPNPIEINNPQLINAKAESLKGLAVLGKIELTGRRTKEVLNSTLTNGVASNLWPENLKLLEIGQVKFFDRNKELGFVTGLSVEEDFFIDADSLRDQKITTSDLVVFTRRPSKKKKGKFESVDVSTEIPCFLFSKNGKSYAIPLVGEGSHDEIPLLKQVPIGAYLIKGGFVGNFLVYKILGDFSNPDNKHQSWAKRALKKQTEYLVENQDSVFWLVEFLLKSGYGDKGFHFLFASLIPKLEYQTFEEVRESVRVLLKFPFIDDFFESVFIAELGKSSFWFWYFGLLPRLPQRHVEEMFWVNEVLPKLETEEFVHLLYKIQKEESGSDRVWLLLNEFLKSPISLKSKQGVERFHEFIDPFYKIFPKFGLEESNFEDSTSEVFLELLDRKILKKLSHEKIKSIIECLGSEDNQVCFIKKFQIEQALDYFGLVNSLRAKKQEYLIEVLGSRISKLDLICFDLEVREGEIKEYAWISEGVLKTNSDYPDFSQGLRDLVFAIKTSDLIIGQNIKGFDLPYLLDLDQDYKERFVWDTLQVEMLLNPIRKSYGLMTSHSADYDTKKTFQLFLNQVFRIVSSGETYQRLKPFLPEQVIEPIERKIFTLGAKYGDKLFFDDESNKFFRPQDLSTFPKETLSKLEELLSTSIKSILLFPEFLWEPISEQFRLCLVSKNKNRSWILSKEQIESGSFDDRFLQGVLLSFIETKALQGRMPYLDQLPHAIRIRISDDQLLELCTSPDPFSEVLSEIPKAIFLEELEWLTNSEFEFQEHQAIVIGEEISRLTTKIQLGQDFDFNTIFGKFPKQEPIWLQLSGGKNYFPLEERHLGYLGIQDVPENVKNIWIEKTGRSQFKVFCNLNIQTQLQGFSFQNVLTLEFLKLESRKTQAFILKPDLKNSPYSAESHRVNSESLYRDKYWVYQFKLFSGIKESIDEIPKVLIVNDSTELDKLASYARTLGFFIPDGRSTLIRQLEILHAYKSGKKLLIVPLGLLSKLISENYLDPLDFIWDSFLLQETFQLLRSDIITGEVVLSDDENPDKDLESKFAESKIDSFSLIKAQKPLVDFFYWRILGNNSDSKLFICDTRLSDYFGIETVFKVSSRSVRLWNNEAHYKSDLEIATKYFPSKNKSQEVDFDLTEAKDLLRYIFLMPDGGNEPYDWRGYQLPYLNEILQAKKDLLISLPTGAGKSVLFQGPSLFRSGFSNKLTLVIVPLRALMQDQVDSLWEKGFYSNVDFISGDKSYVEIKDIYRRISGGEITMLFITPERFRARAFENCLLSRITSDDGLEFAVFDEAHCISQWGLDFRPDYMNAARKISEYSSRFSMKKLLFSATISEQVSRDINRLIGNIEVVEGSEKNYNPVRDHIRMNFKHNVVDDERLIDLGNYLKSGNFNPKISRAIFFVKSRKKVEECALIFSDYLEAVFGKDCTFKEKIGAFHAGMDSEDRRETYDKFKAGGLVILFATKAFGMGMDIPNIHFVGHLSPSNTFEDFLQEIGRAGRNEEQRNAAGFDNSENPIKTLCLTSSDDFSLLKDQLLDSRISWHEVKEVKTIVENYVKKFRPLESASEVPVAISFDLYTKEKGTTDEDLSTNFRLALHWLEKMDRIRLGYLTLTHLELFVEPLRNLGDNLSKCPDEETRKVCEAILKLFHNTPEQIGEEDLEPELVQISLTDLREESKLGLSNLYTALLKAHNLKLIKLNQEVLIEPTKLRLDEISHGLSKGRKEDRFPAINFVFSLARKVLNTVPLNDSKIFDGGEFDHFISEALEEEINFNNLPWSKREKEESKEKEFLSFKKDLIEKRAKHAFTLIRLLGKRRHESKMKKSTDSSRKAVIIQSVFNGYHKKEEWSNKLSQIEKDVKILLAEIANSSIKKNIKSFNWADLIDKIHLKEDVNYLSDLLFILSVLGYCKSGSIFPSGIEIYLQSIVPIDETDLQSDDNKIFEEFEESRKVRELKLIALEVLAGFQKSQRNEEEIAIRKKQDAFIRKYFTCESLDGLLNLLQEELTPNHPLLIKWRGDAIKFEEDRLNIEQRQIYDAEVNQHISVMAGPGSGKTHTLTLRVARLVHHIGINPDEILVLAYNRAVVSELKDRLGKLFNELGYGKLSKRLKIFTFHGLAKRYCQEKLNNKEFSEWESTLLSTLRDTPGEIFGGLGNLKHILVDEFQDINTVRIKLLKDLQLLTKSHLFIIGDPNQSIYGYERENEGGSLSPWPYYKDFNQIFNPSIFKLFKNHRSYPKILEVASKLLDLPEDQKDLIPSPIRQPEEDYLKEYVQIFDTTVQKADWWTSLEGLTNEKIGGKSYKQIAVLFRTNNEVYRGFQKIRSLNITGIRIRIQGSLPYEFIRIRECFEVIHFIKKKQGNLVRSKFETEIGAEINRLITAYPTWNQFYLRVIQSLILEFLSDEEDNLTFLGLLDYLVEMGIKDDGQLFKIYEKYRDQFFQGLEEVEIVLSTMHKVKGLEFDCVVVPPSFSNLPLRDFAFDESGKLAEIIEEESRLTYVAYTRARFRLLVFKHKREMALDSSQSFRLDESINSQLGIPAIPGLSKLVVGFAAKDYNYNTVSINQKIKLQIKSGDPVLVQKKVNGKHTFFELHHEILNIVIGSISSSAGRIKDFNKVSGFVVNEVVIWTYEDSMRSDERNGTSFSSQWCPEAKALGYVYVVDFAGYGKGE